MDHSLNPRKQPAATFSFGYAVNRKPWKSPGTARSLEHGVEVEARPVVKFCPSGELAAQSAVQTES
jgi:uncharacterized Fe-S cluster protein YjdI